MNTVEKVLFNAYHRSYYKLKLFFQILKSHFSISSYLDTNPDTKPQGKQFFADDGYDGFDDFLFNISPKEARAFGPPMRLLMPDVPTAHCVVPHRPSISHHMPSMWVCEALLPRMH